MTKAISTLSKPPLGIFLGYRDFYVQIPPKEDGVRHPSESIWDIVDAFEVLYAQNPIHQINGRLRDYCFWGRTNDEDGQARVLISLPPTPNKTADEMAQHLSKLMDKAVSQVI